jgi:thymidylate synthase
MNGFNVVSNEEFALVEKMRKEKEHEEYQYLHLLQNILDNGVTKSDRTGTGTKSLFGTQLKFDLSKSFPILTTKKVFFKGVVEELLWFIRGETDSKLLEAKGVNIWKGNTSKEFLSKRGLNYPEGMIGVGYGWQWRNWGGHYGKMWSSISSVNGVQYTFISNPKEAEKRFTNEPTAIGIDQLANVINTLKKNPNDRRMIVSAWNVAEIDKMALPPCHIMMQFNVTNNTKLSCSMFALSVSVLFLGERVIVACGLIIYSTSFILSSNP